MPFPLGDPQMWAALATLTALEIVLAVDNVIFISIVTGRLAPPARDRVRRFGILLALVVRLALLTGIAWLAGLTRPVVEVADLAFSWRDLILIGGGLFLLVKGTSEIHRTVEGEGEGEGEAEAAPARPAAGAGQLAVVGQVVVIDAVFSLDSIITAVGMTRTLAVMYAAVVISMIVMLVASGPIAAFIHRHPTVKMLALSFLLLVGMALIADGFQVHVPRGYVYFAIAFSITVEALNLAAARRRARRRAAGG